MNDRELMTKAFKALEIFHKCTPTDQVQKLLYELEDRISDILEQEKRYKMSKEARDKMRMAAEGNRNTWKPELDAPYQEIKQLVAPGVQVTCACKAVGMGTDAYYRRRRIETRGRDR